MDCKDRHQEHDHLHNETCGHTAIRQGDRTGYLHEGHMHIAHGDHFDCSAVEVSTRNPDACTREQGGRGHDGEHKHGSHCGHERIPHGNHTDYLVDDRLHHEHGDHCDDHGPVEVRRGSRAA